MPPMANAQAHPAPKDLTLEQLFAPLPGAHSFLEFDCPVVGQPVKLRYVLFGEGPERLMLVPGAGMPIEGWLSQVNHYRRDPRYTVCTYDNRGTAHSSTPTFFAATSQYAQDVWRLADHIGWTGKQENFHIVGISMGGMTTLEAACSEAGHRRFKSVTLCNTHRGGVRGIPPVTGALKMVKMMAAKDKREAARQLLSVMYHSTFAAKHPERVERWVEGFAAGALPPPTVTGSFSQYLATMRHYISDERLAALKATDIPVMVCVSSEDQLVRTLNGPHLAERLGARLEVFEGVGHGLNSEDPIKFNRVLATHMEAAHE